MAEEAAKRLLHDLTLERKAKKAERIGVGVAKRLALVQADTWANRSEAGDIHELDPLLVEEATCTRTDFSTLVDDLAHQGHLLVRKPTDNSDSGAVTLAFHGQAPPLTRKDSTSTRQQAVLGQSGERSTTSSKHDEKEFYHCTSLGGQDIQCTHSHPDHLPLPVSLEPEDDHAHTHQCCDYFISQAGELSGESQHVLSILHVCGMEGKRRKIASFADPGGPRAPLRTNFDDPEGWDTSSSEEECVQRDEVHRMALVAGRPIIKCGNSGCTGSCPLSVVEYGYKAGKKPATMQNLWEDFPAPEHLWNQESKRLSYQVSKVKCVVLERSDV